MFQEIARCDAGLDKPTPREAAARKHSASNGKNYSGEPAVSRV
jgi:hypothetical protein